MNIIFVGCVTFSLRCLEKLVGMRANVVGVVTKLSSPSNSDFVDLASFSEKENIPYHHTKNVNSPETLAWIRSKKPNIVFCFGWSNLLKDELLHIAPMGVLGFHPTLLPRNRGRHPIIWSLVLGLSQTGSTFFFMDEGADSGDILSQKIVSISFSDQAIDVYERVVTTALSQLEEFLPFLTTGNFRRVPQQHQDANYWRKRTSFDGKIDFRMTSQAIYNLVRALSRPYVGAHFVKDGNEIKVWRVMPRICCISNIECGKVIENTTSTFTVKTCDGAIDILDHECPAVPEVGAYL